ncbi:MAG: hypothetical protein ACLVFU_01915 [Eggerthellaceae bacterium]
MITKGNVSTFSFYVRAFDTKNNYRNYGEPATQLSLEQAKEEFAKRCAQNPLSVNTMLGVSIPPRTQNSTSMEWEPLICFSVLTVI